MRTKSAKAITAAESAHIARVNIYIHAPKPTEVGCVVLHCPTCDRPRRMFFEHFEWYGSDVYCAGCGEHWQDGQMVERPFVPGWRKRQREHARSELAKIGVPA